MTTELEMKQALDGWFFVYNCEKQAVTKRKVSKNYIPVHKPPDLQPPPAPTAYPWKPTEDDYLVELRERNLSWREIAKYLGLSPSCARFRYIELCHRRGVAEHKVTRRIEACALEARVMALRAQDKSFADIAYEIGVTRNKVAGIVQRVRRRLAFEEMAA